MAHPENVNYGGKTQDLKEGINTGVLAIGNDVVSSIKVDNGLKVTLFEHNPTKGKQLEITADTPDPATLNFDNITSTVKVEKIK